MRVDLRVQVKNLIPPMLLKNIKVKIDSFKIGVGPAGLAGVDLLTSRGAKEPSCESNFLNQTFTVAPCCVMERVVTC